MLKFSLSTVFGVLALVGVLVGIKAGQIGFMINMGQNFVQPPAIVNSSVVIQDTWEDVIYTPGELEAINGVMISAQSGGNIEKIHFVAGSDIEKGALILSQETISESTQLVSAKSAQSLAKKKYDRASPLLKSKDISQEDYDLIFAQYEQAKAQVRNVESVIAKKNIIAPFAGRVGIELVDNGQYLQPGDPIVSIQDISTVLVNFSLPQNRSRQVKVGQTVRVVGYRDGSDKILGKVTAISPDVDVRTRNISLQASIENVQELLKPGMFVDVELVIAENVAVKSIPVTAVLSAPYGDTVFVIEESVEDGEKIQRIRQKFIRTGRKKGDFVEVVEGLELGEKIVTTGLFKLFNGQSVVEENESSLKFSTNPVVKDA